jgi:hypothetical protein
MKKKPFLMLAKALAIMKKALTWTNKKAMAL